MGFECNFHLMPKIEGMTAEETLLCVNYQKHLKSKNSEWGKRMQEHGVELNFTDFSGKHLPVPPKEKHECFKDYVENNGDKVIDYWCSIGRAFDEKIADILEQVSFDNDYYSYRVVTDRSQLLEIEQFVVEYLNNHMLKPVYAEYGYVENEDGTITLIPINGVVACFGEAEKRIPTTDADEYESAIYASQNYYEEEEYNAYERLRNTIDLLKAVDFEKNWIVFERSY